MRQIQEVLTTQDGQHALALCTDGGILYYHQTITSSSQSTSPSTVSNAIDSSDSDNGHADSFNSSNSKLLSTGTLVEFQSLTREVEIGPKYMTDGAWCLKRVGCRGAVVLVRSCKNVSKNNSDNDSDEDEEDDDFKRGSLIDISLLSGN